MRPVRFHHDPNAGAGRGGSAWRGGAAGASSDSPTPEGGRLNLLLSHAGWQDECWADRLPRLLEPMGVWSHRAATAREATRVIETVPIHVAIVDLGLPMDEAPKAGDEGGPRLLELLARTSTRPPTVIIKRQLTARDDRRELAAALRAGAFAVIDRPADTRGLETLLEVLRRIVARHYRGQWPGAS